MNAAPAEAVRALSEYLRKNGLKNTRQRDIIVEAFYEAGGHVSIDDLLARVQVKMPGVGYATAYRTLKLLNEAGLAHERRFNDGQARYEPVVADDDNDRSERTVLVFGTSCRS